MPKQATKERAKPKARELDGATQPPMAEVELEDLAGVEEQEYEVVDIDSLFEHPENPNKGDDGAVAESVDVNGWYGAVIAQVSTGYILAGNTRWRVAKSKGVGRIPVIWKDVDDVTALRILLADNEVARRAVIDKDHVGRILDELGSLDGTGFRGLEDLAADERADEERQAAEEATRAAEEADLDLPYEPGDDVYAQQYGVIVVCEDEADQREKYDQLKELGWTIRVVAV